MIANVISRNIRGDTVLDDQCAWYGLSYLIDTTLGLVLAVIGLRFLDDLANEHDWAHLKHSGVYDGPDGNKHWFSQVVAWLFILTVVKLIIYLFMWVFSEPLAWIGKIIFAPFQGHKKFELLFVMIFFPGFLNVIYFWIAGTWVATACCCCCYYCDECHWVALSPLFLNKTDTHNPWVPSLFVHYF
jgi:hypothetical protein